MIKDYTCKHRFDHYNPNEDIKSIRLDNASLFITEDSKTESQTYHWLVGEVADRLYDYEALGYSPEELKHIIDMYKTYKSQSYQTYGQCSSHSPIDLSRSEEFIMANIIDKAANDKNIHVSIFFGPAGISIDMNPPEEKEEEENG